MTDYWKFKQGHIPSPQIFLIILGWLAFIKNILSSPSLGIPKKLRNVKLFNINPLSANPTKW